ncbi:hypothetical protein HKD42_11825 [Altererythrobacter sp. RZ02]|uniref:Uncharacterized protein n=1 Tax=Pontixanthobacter rizhaonensis TaxID=2730337 RepID=A0A848QGJ4_9SPHN|nr:hypothetical protein [Pontixanthobacter rizhaonensis]NMW32751.1 hypothetical protein [Pontixanthobacter rizhaonensis]
MPIKFLDGDFHSYNKGQPVGKPKPSYGTFPTVVELSNGWVARVSVPLPDKIRLAIDVSDEIYSSGFGGLSVASWVKQTGDHLKGEPCNSQHLNNAYNPAWEYPYRFVEMGLGKREAMVRFEFRRPTKQSPPRLWITTNPRKLGPEGFKTLVAMLSNAEGPFAIKPLLQSAKVTMLDVAVDIVGLQTSDLVIFHPYVGKRQHYVGADDVLETIYLHRKPFKSKPAGNAFVKVYDRRRERIAAGKNAPHGATEVTRVEVTSRRKHPYNAFSKLLDFSDPFKGLKVGFVCDQNPISRDWLSYHALTRTMKPEKAAQMLGLTPVQQQSFDEALQVTSNPLVAGKLSWAGWSEGVQKTGLMQLLLAAA